MSRGQLLADPAAATRGSHVPAGAIAVLARAPPRAHVEHGSWSTLGL